MKQRNMENLGLDISSACKIERKRLRNRKWLSKSVLKKNDNFSLSILPTSLHESKGSKGFPNLVSNPRMADEIIDGVGYYLLIGVIYIYNVLIVGF